MKKIKDILPFVKLNSSIDSLIDSISNEIYKNQLNNGKNPNLQSIKGYVFETITQLLIFTKCSTFGKVDYFEGNVNKNNLKKVSSLKTFLNKNIITGNVSGFSDIAFGKDINGKYQYYISTSKYFLDNNSKNLSNYDLSKLDSITSNITDLNDSKYLIFVSNKDEFINIYNKSNSSSTDFYKKRIDLNENVFGIDEIQSWYEKLRILLSENNYDINYIDEKFIDTDRKILTPFYHQDLAITWLSNQIYNSNLGTRKSKKVLLDVLQGQGKTYIIFGLILHLLKIGKKYNYLLTTHRPSLFKQWIEPFYEYLGLEKINVINYLEDREKYTTEEWEETIKNKNNIILISLQAIRNHKNEKYDDLKNIVFDIEVRDETQEGFETEMSYDILKNIRSIFKIYLSGTPQKNEYLQIYSGEFDGIYRWTFFDLMEAQTGHHNNKDIDNYSLDFYKNIPTLSYYMYEWSSDFVEMLIKKGFPKDEYPTPKKIFEVKDNSFVYEKIIKFWIEKQLGDPSTMTGWLFDNKYNSNTKIITLDKKEQQTQLQKCLNEVLNKEINPYFDIHIINSDIYSAKNLLDNVKNLSSGIYGRILLIVDQLRVGSNIHDADTIIKLDSKKSFPINSQTDLRLLRGYKNKTNVRVIDPCPYRGYNLYNTLLKTEPKKGKNEDKPILLKSLPLYHNGTKMINSTKEYLELLSKYNGSYYNEDVSDYTLRVRKMYNLGNARNNFDLLSNIPSSNSKLSKKNKYQENGLGDKDKLGNSAKIEKSNKGKKLEDRSIQSHIETFYSSLFYLPFLNNFKETNIRNILNDLNEKYIYDNKTNKKIFYEKEILYCNIDIIIKLLDNNVLNEDNINIYINELTNDFKKITKKDLSISERLKNIYNLIENYRKTSEIERKIYGEVFTPFDLIEEMVNTIPSEFWTNPNLKILDPANGIGNFPLIVIIKLMDGLKEEFPDEEDRYKHILKNIIHIVEYQPKNMFIYLQIFDPEDKYNLNYYSGSFLDSGFENAMNKWGIKNGFDLVIGNPPYQEDGATGDNKYYLRFMNKALQINKNKYLLFVTPKNSIDYLLNISKNRDYINNFYEILYIAIDTPKRYFDVGSTFCFFLIKNKIVNSNSQENIQCEYLYNDDIKKTEINITKGKKLPSILDHNIYNIIEKIEKKYKSYDLKKMVYSNKQNRKVYRRIRDNFIKDGTVSENKDTKYKYPIIAVINETFPYPGKLYYFDKKMDDFDEKKILLSGQGYLSPSYCEGGYNLSDSMYYIKINNKFEYDNFLSIVNSNVFNLIKKIYFNDDGYSAIKTFTKIGGLDLSKKWNNEDIYQYYNINTDEQKIIEDIIK